MANRTEPGLAAWPQRAGCMVALGSSNHFQRNPESERYSGSVTASRTHSKRARNFRSEKLFWSGLITEPPAYRPDAENPGAKPDETLERPTRYSCKLNRMKSAVFCAHS